MALLAGLWFVVGPSVSMLWEDGELGTGAALGDTGTRVLEWLGYFYGDGRADHGARRLRAGVHGGAAVVDEVRRPLPATGRREPPHAAPAQPRQALPSREPDPGTRS